MKKYNEKFIIVVCFLLTFLSGCENEGPIETRDIFNSDQVESNDELDIYLKNEFRDPFGSVVIYKFVDRFISPNRFAVPPERSVVRPVAELVKQAWIEPYNRGADIGVDFMKRYFPAELVFIGSPLFNNDGTITLGVADAGVRVTLTEVNGYSPGDTRWIQRSFSTLHHEFAHIIDQNFNFDDQVFFKISGSDYTSPGSWTGVSSDDAISRGMVTPYGTSAVGEDFAELVAAIVTTPPEIFAGDFFPQDCSMIDDPEARERCQSLQEGRSRILEKYNLVIDYFTNDVGVDLLKVRDEFLKSLN